MARAPLVAGGGELLGYSLRLLSGYLTDRSGAYWPLTFLGYGVNLVAVPFLAWAGSWELAVLLIVAERAGKEIRAPARDAMLSHAGSQTGLGFAFGLHGALEQTGAVLGRGALLERRLSNRLRHSCRPSAVCDADARRRAAFVSLSARSRSDAS